ncbi:hypothetical protein ACJ72_06092 [Emergomyces africanus]|uniref:F-type H+-transporting ATPase subunit J n=1 Tax=Emergomyces africanus TaxID=1955775 RepID=A0A1B7NS22_9EURO|nr:hypothetical protein ACJ72_06092 [Emergomyces africanus]
MELLNVYLLKFQRGQNQCTDHVMPSTSHSDFPSSKNVQQHDNPSQAPPRIPPLSHLPTGANQGLSIIHIIFDMSLLGRKFPAPVAKPMLPFFAAGLIVLYGVNGFANVLINTDEFKNDPRNPRAQPAKAPEKH